jgi:hypothetical protein
MPSTTYKKLQKPEISGENHALAKAITLAGIACLSFGDGVIRPIAGEWPGSAVGALRHAIGTFGLFFNDYSDPMALGGATLIIAAGLWLWEPQGTGVAPA